MTTTYDINTIQAEMTANGSRWWDYDTMRQFGTRVVSPVYCGPGGIYFVTSDRQFDDSTACTIRQYHADTMEIRTVGEFGNWTKSEAIAEARRLAGDGAITVDGKLRPIAQDEQFRADMIRHGIAGATIRTARSLMAQAKRHHAACEHQCNGGEIGDTMRRTAELAILRMTRKLGCGVIFSGDPRGATVRLVMPDGASNGFASDGWIVPTRD